MNVRGDAQERRAHERRRALARLATRATARRRASAVVRRMATRTAPQPNQNPQGGAPRAERRRRPSRRRIVRSDSLEQSTASLQHDAVSYSFREVAGGGRDRHLSERILSRSIRDEPRLIKVPARRRARAVHERTDEGALLEIGVASLERLRARDERFVALAHGRPRLAVTTPEERAFGILVVPLPEERVGFCKSAGPEERVPSLEELRGAGALRAHGGELLLIARVHRTRDSAGSPARDGRRGGEHDEDPHHCWHVLQELLIALWKILSATPDGRDLEMRLTRMS